MKQSILLIGGGGHCASVIDVIESTGLYKIAGIVDLKENLGKKLLGYKYIGIDADLPRLISQYKNVIITTGMTKRAELRTKLYVTAVRIGSTFPIIVSPIAYVSKHAKIGKGTVIMHHAVVNAGSTVGDNCILNTKSLIEHDSKIGTHCHISTGAIVNGSCNIGDQVMIGSNAVVSHGISIASHVIIGASSVVVKSIKESCTVVGNPAKTI